MSIKVNVSKTSFYKSIWKEQETGSWKVLYMYTGYLLLPHKWYHHKKIVWIQAKIDSRCLVFLVQWKVINIKPSHILKGKLREKHWRFDTCCTFLNIYADKQQAGWEQPSTHYTICCMNLKQRNDWKIKRKCLICK